MRILRLTVASLALLAAPVRAETPEDLERLLAASETAQGALALASVRFTGSLREAPGAAAEPFSEVWNLVKPLSGRDGWLLAGIQQEPAK